MILTWVEDFLDHSSQVSIKALFSIRCTILNWSILTRLILMRSSLIMTAVIIADGFSTDGLHYRMQSLCSAARVIQSVWRGHAARKRLTKLHGVTFADSVHSTAAAQYSSADLPILTPVSRGRSYFHSTPGRIGLENWPEFFADSDVADCHELDVPRCGSFPAQPADTSGIVVGILVPAMREWNTSWASVQVLTKT